MKTLKFLSGLFLAVVALCAVSAAKAVDSSSMHYRLQVRIEPDSHKLEGEAWIHLPPSSKFTLNKNFSIREIMADGKAVAFSRDASRKSNVVVAVPEARELHIKYEGEISKVMSDVNMIAPDLVELALYSDWYPRFREAKGFTFDLQADLPAEFVTTTNGQRAAAYVQEGRRVTRWTSYQPGFDIVLLASPKLQVVQGGNGALRVEMFYSELPQAAAKSKVEALAGAMDRLSALYGPAKVKGVLRFVYSPRAGWEYSRIPLFVVSEQRAQKAAAEPDNGAATEYMGNCHEMAHFWWNIVDMSTPNDWINESLAEFSALRLAEARYGKPYAEKRLAKYREHAAQSKTASAIAETENGSPDRYVNRYEKTTLMLVEARRRFGEESLNGFLKAFYARFAGTYGATTAAFLEQARASMGPEAEKYFRDELYRRPAVASAAQSTAAN